ncbi:MAG: hypothetical protein WC749_05720 [Dehalococcoidia bacterium]
METDTKQEDGSTPAPQANEQQAEQTMEQIQAELKEAKATAEKLKKDVADSTRASQKWQQRAQRMDAVDGKLATIESMIANLAKSGSLLDEDAVKKWEESVRASRPVLSPTEQGLGAALEVDLEEEGIDFDNPPEIVAKAIPEAQALWVKGDLKGSVKVVRKAIKDYKKAQTDHQKETDETDKAERQKKASALKDVRVTPQGSSGVRRFSLNDVRQFSPEKKTVAEMRAELEAMKKQIRGG